MHFLKLVLMPSLCPITVCCFQDLLSRNVLHSCLYLGLEETCPSEGPSYPRLYLWDTFLTIPIRIQETKISWIPSESAAAAVWNVVVWDCHWWQHLPVWPNGHINLSWINLPHSIFNPLITCTEVTVTAFPKIIKPFGPGTLFPDSSSFGTWS